MNQKTAVKIIELANLTTWHLQANSVVFSNCWFSKKNKQPSLMITEKNERKMLDV